MKRRTQIAALLLLLSLGVPAAAGEPRARNSPAPGAATPALSPTETVARGHSLYAHYCSHCHGFNMVNAGNVSYDLRRFPREDKARFVNSVTNGKNGRMPPWGSVLSAEELDQLWAYVLTGGKQ